MTNYEVYYQGTPYSMEPSYGQFTGYRMSAGKLGIPTSIQTADQIREVSNAISQGAKAVEMQPISPEIFEQIPKQHFQEIQRLAKLTGVETSVHAPITDPSGFTKEGWSEENRVATERQLQSTIERSYEASPKGNMPVVIHSSGLPGTEWMKGKEGFEEAQIIAVNQQTGQLIPVKREERYEPETGKIGLEYPRKMLDIINNSEWSNTLLRNEYTRKEVDDIMRDIIQAKPLLQRLSHGQQLSEEEQNILNTQVRKINQAHSMMSHILASLRTSYNEAYRYDPNPENKEMLNKVSQEYAKILEEMQECGQKKDIESFYKMTEKQSQAVDLLMGGLSHSHPKLYKPIEEFAQDKSSETFANVALSAYKKYGSNAPVISIENPPAGMALSRSEEMKNLIEESRKKFVEKAVKDGYSASEAGEMAKKLIGATWDVGHINMLRRFGYDPADVVKETEKIAPYVKHMHLTDNFGYSDSHLPPGMGNIPIKEMMESLEKAGFEGRGVVEAGAFAAQFKTSPHPFALEAFGSPIYAMAMAPYWNQAVGLQQGYFAGFGTYLPEQHFSMYGSGFSNLPTELGGQISGRQSRVSGTPMD